MRLTSKILIGMFVVILITSVCVLTRLASLYDNSFEKGTTLEGEQVKIEMPSECKVLVLKMDIPDEWKDLLYEFKKKIEGDFELKVAATEIEKNRLTVISEAESFINRTVSNDTLLLSLDFDKLYAKYYDNGFGRIKGLNFTFHSDSIIDIVNNIPGLCVSATGLTAKSLSLTSLAGDIRVEGSRFLTFTPISHLNNNKLILKESIIDTLNLDMDGIPGWREMDNCDIDVLNLIGYNDSEYGGNKNYDIDTDFCKTVNWLPKDDNVTLTLRVHTTPGKKGSFTLPQ
ncbi:MAG: hypothetical protein E6767_10100 [Dysgonomonas sp.]|nr:hypothetical protein [Dysgonomonas sp.]